MGRSFKVLMVCLTVACSAGVSHADSKKDKHKKDDIEQLNDRMARIEAALKHIAHQKSEGHPSVHNDHQHHGTDHSRRKKGYSPRGKGAHGIDSHYGRSYDYGRILIDDVLNEKARDLYKAEREAKAKKLLESILKPAKPVSTSYVVPPSYAPTKTYSSYSYSTPIYTAIDCPTPAIESYYYPLAW